MRLGRCGPDRWQIHSSTELYMCVGDINYIYILILKQWTPWTSCQFIAGLTYRDKPPSTLRDPTQTLGDHTNSTWKRPDSELSLGPSVSWQCLPLHHCGRYLCNIFLFSVLCTSNAHFIITLNIIQTFYHSYSQDMQYVVYVHESAITEWGMSRKGNKNCNIEEKRITSICNV